MTLFLYILGLLISFGLLHLISEYYFIDSLEAIARRFKIPSDIAGSTLMAAGSSAPELAVVLFALFLPGEHQDIGIGTIVGSALFNVLVIIGYVLVIVRPSKIRKEPIIRDLVFYTISVLMLIVFFRDGQLSLVEAGTFVILYVLYILVMYAWSNKFPYADQEKLSEPEPDAEKGKN